MLNWFIDGVYIRTLISPTVPFSVHKTVKKQIQQHSAAHYISWLRWTAMNLRLQQTVSHFFLFRSPTTFETPSAVCFLWLLFVCVQLSVLKASEVQKNLSSWGRLILSYWQSDKKNPANVQGAVTHPILHHSSCLSHIIYVPRYLNF